MLFRKFKQQVKILNSKTADSWREKYIRRFINTSKGRYKEAIETLKKCSDGYCYRGYLWEYLRSEEVIPFEEVKKKLISQISVMVLWDNHSRDKIVLPNYWRFGKADVLLSRGSLLVNNLSFLPEDVYIFDKTLSWSLVLTHEELSKGRRLCFIEGKV